MLRAFDLIELDGDDLRPLPISLNLETGKAIGLTIPESLRSGMRSL